MSAYDPLLITVVPPKNKRELFERLTEIVQHGLYEMPVRYGGTGGPGTYLEHLLGLTTGNKDIPDSRGWELKFYSKGTNLITLFHKEPQPTGIIRYLVSKYGWKDKQDRLSFRHTIAGKSDRFFENLQLSFFIYEVVRGTIKIDFDAREASPGSKGLRNHGTKFRVEPDNVCRLYAKKERIS